MLTPSPRRRLRLPLLAACAASVVLLAGCSGSVSASSGSDYDPDEVAQQIVKAQKEATPDLEVTDGSCPADEDIKLGATFECTISIAGVTAPYTAKVTSVKDGTASFSADPSQAILSATAAADFLTGQLTEQGFTDATASCGDAPVIVQDPQTTFPCTISYSDGTSQEIVATISDLAGNITFAEAS